MIYKSPSESVRLSRSGHSVGLIQGVETGWGVDDSSTYVPVIIVPLASCAVKPCQSLSAVTVSFVKSINTLLP